jgi:hypothetical protein
MDMRGPLVLVAEAADRMLVQVPLLEVHRRLAVLITGLNLPAVTPQARAQVVSMMAAVVAAAITVVVVALQMLNPALAGVASLTRRLFPPLPLLQGAAQPRQTQKVYYPADMHQAKRTSSEHRKTEIPELCI